MEGQQVVVEAQKVGADAGTATLTLTNLKLFGHGVFANVYTGLLVQGDKSREVAVKKCWSTRDDILEVRILRMLNQKRFKHVANLLYTFKNKYDNKFCFSLVMDFMPTSLSAYIKQRRPEPLEPIDTKLFAWQVFRALQYMSSHKVIHRDLKPQNILLEPESGLIQVADFGSSAMVGEQYSMSSYHVTRYYRPPELLLGAHQYGAEIDVWSAGCVFGEMLRGRTFLAGQTTDDQLVKIVNTFGLPTDFEQKNMKIRKPKLLEAEKVVEAERSFKSREAEAAGVKKLLPKAPPQALRLMTQIMTYNPYLRLSGPKLLADKYFDDIFDPNVQRRGRPITVIGHEDLVQASTGDQCSDEMQSHTGPSVST